MYDEAEVKGLQHDLEVGLEDVRADFPEVECGYELDLAVGVALTAEASEDSRREFLRREFGYVPQQYLSVRGV